MNPRRTRPSRQALAGLALLSLALPALPARADDSVPRCEALTPEGEKERLGDHDADLEGIRFRPGKGLSVTSEDDQFELVTRLRVQMLAAAADAPGEETELGLMLRRARLQFLGHVFGEHNTFKSELAFSPRDLRMTEIDSTVVTRESPLLSWYLEFDHLRDLTVRIGQYKIPFSRQRVISSGNLQMVDRSIANGEFTLDRDIGIDVRSKNFLGLDRLRYYLGVYNGEGRSVFSSGDASLMYLGRIEFLPLGMFKDYGEADFERLARPGVSIGLAYAYADDAVGTRVNRGGAPDDGGTTDTHTVAADVMLKYLGFSLQSEIFWREGDRNPGSAVGDDGMPLPVEEARNGYGWFTQAGYLLPRQPVEIAGRFGQVKAQGDSSLEDLNEAGAAVSYYFAGHPFKLQADVFQLWNGDFTDGTSRVRVQMQLAF